MWIDIFSEEDEEFTSSKYGTIQIDPLSALIFLLCSQKNKVS